MNFKPKQSTLNNGLRVVYLPMGTDSVTVLCLVGTGSRWETKTNNGISHFLEHMVFKGTKKYTNAFKISSAIDSIGAEFNAFTGKEQTGFYVKASVKHLELALDMVCQLVCYPLIRPKDINRERGVIVEEINMYEDQPMVKVAKMFNQLVYGSTPLGWEVIGKKDNVLKISQADFISYRKKWYQPNNMVLVLAGGQKKLNGLVSKYFASIPKGISQAKKQLKKINSTKKINLFYKQTEQAHFCLGVKGLKSTHKDRYALAVLATLLGGGMSSRLFTEVREKRGLAYYVKTRKEGYWETGHFVSQAGTDIKKVYQAIKITKQEYQEIQAGVAKEELIKAKEYLKGHLVLNLEDSHEVAGMLASDWLLEGKIRTPKLILSQIDKVSNKDIIRLAKELLKPERFKLAVVGPYKNKQKFAKLLE